MEEIVKKKVTQLSGGKQRPITRGVNREFDPILVKFAGSSTSTHNSLPRETISPISDSAESSLNPQTIHHIDEAANKETGKNQSDAPQAGDNYTVAYKGNDGVSIRSSPSGDIIATAYFGPDTRLTILSEAPEPVDGLEWVQVKVDGWLAKRNLKSGDINIATLADGTGVITWDGGGDPNDNFIAMRTLGSKGNRIAKVYYRTKVILGESKNSGNYEWAKSSFIGWIPIRGPKGTLLIDPIK